MIVTVWFVALWSLAAMNAPLFETGDATVFLHVSNAHASTALARLAAPRDGGASDRGT